MMGPLTVSELLREIGVEEPDIDAHVIALKPGHPYLRLPLQFSVALESRLLEALGAAIDTWRQTVRDAPANAAVDIKAIRVAAMSFLMCSSRVYCPCLASSIATALPDGK